MIAQRIRQATVTDTTSCCAAGSAGTGTGATLGVDSEARDMGRCAIFEQAATKSRARPCLAVQVPLVQE